MGNRFPIYHISRREGGQATEYIVPKKSIDITSHGLGSGIYGLTDEKGHSLRENEYLFEMKNPYIIMDDQGCDMFIFASTSLNKALQERQNVDTLIADFLRNMDDPKFDEEGVYNALDMFLYDYNTRTDLVKMPINYILESYGYDGVIAHPNSACNAMNKGSVKFLPYPKEGVVTDGVRFFCTRDGVKKNCIVYNPKPLATTKNPWRPRRFKNPENLSSQK